MAHTLIHHEHHRNPVCFGEIECLDHQVKALLRGIGAEGDNFIVTVRSPPGLHHIGLSRQGGQPGGRTSTLYIDKHAGNFRDRCQSNMLHHQGKTRARGHSHHLFACPCSTQDSNGRGQLIFHLNKDPSDQRDPCCKPFDHLSGGGNWIAGNKAAPCCQCTFARGVVTIQIVGSGKNPFWIRLHGFHFFLLFLF